MSKCIAPPELDELQLLLYLDGQAGTPVSRHIGECDHCRARAGQLARLQGDLTSRLYRAACPSSLELGEYHLGLLAGARTAEIAGHLKECPHCRWEVAQLQGYLTDLAPELELAPLEQVKEQVKVLVARLVGGMAGGLPFQPAPAPAYAGLRGEETAPAIYRADGIQIVVEVQPDPDRPDRRSILGLVMPEPGGPSVAEVNLWQAGQRIATTPLDELGNFLISGLRPGSYDLILGSPELEIRIEGFEVGRRAGGG